MTKDILLPSYNKTNILQCFINEHLYAKSDKIY